MVVHFPGPALSHHRPRLIPIRTLSLLLLLFLPPFSAVLGDSAAGGNGWQPTRQMMLFPIEKIALLPCGRGMFSYVEEDGSSV